MHRFFNRLLLNCPKPNMYAVSSMTYPQNNRHYCAFFEPCYSSYKTDQHRLLKCCHGYRNKTPHYLSMRNFHLNSVFFKMSKKLKKHVKGTDSFENKNWNLQSDKGLNELLEEMKKELTNSETNFSSETDQADSGHTDTLNDPELKEILADIRKDFQDKKYQDNNFVDDTLSSDTKWNKGKSSCTKWNKGKSYATRWNKGKYPGTKWNTGKSSGAKWNKGKSYGTKWNKGKYPGAKWNTGKSPGAKWNKGKTYGTKWNKGDPIRKSSSERYRLILASIIVVSFTSIIMSYIYSK